MKKMVPVPLICSEGGASGADALGEETAPFVCETALPDF
jgi:hypothetical protein